MGSVKRPHRKFKTEIKKYHQLIIVSGVVALFVLAGFIIINSHAAGPLLSVQPEAGALTSPASRVTDSTASGGSAIRFGSAVELPTPVAPPPVIGAPSCTTTVSPGGNISASIAGLTAGQTLCIHGGTYNQNVTPGSMPKGTATARITIMSYPGQKAMIVGHSAFSAATYVTIRDLDFSWPTSPTGSGGSAAVISITGAANNFIFENNNVHNGNYAGLLVGANSATAAGPTNSTIRNNYIHDTGAVGLYFNPGQASRAMLIERNLFMTAGTENVKLGWGGGACDFGVGEVAFRYNTLYNSIRHFNLIIADPANQGVGKIDVHHNIFNKAPAAAVQFDNNAGCLGNRSDVHDNIWSDAPKLFNIRGTSAQYTAANNNQISPQFNDVSDPVNGFRPGNAAAQPYGKYAP